MRTSRRPLEHGLVYLPPPPRASLAGQVLTILGVGCLAVAFVLAIVAGMWMLQAIHDVGGLN